METGQATPQTVSWPVAMSQYVFLPVGLSLPVKEVHVTSYYDF